MKALELFHMVIMTMNWKLIYKTGIVSKYDGTYIPPPRDSVLVPPEGKFNLLWLK